MQKKPDPNMASRLYAHLFAQIPAPYKNEYIYAERQQNVGRAAIVCIVKTFVALLSTFAALVPGASSSFAFPTAPVHLVLTVVFALFLLLFVQMFRGRLANSVAQNAALITFYVLYIASELFVLMQYSGHTASIIRFVAAMIALGSIPVLPRSLSFAAPLVTAVLGSIIIYQGTPQVAIWSHIYFTNLALALFVSIVLSLLNTSSFRSAFAARYEMGNHNEELHRLNAELQKLSRTDQLTRVANRRALLERLDVEWHQCQRQHQPLTILMFDIDYFKRYNDRFGHPAGDSCLSLLARTIDGFFRRAGDLFARFGGEEFVAMLPYTENDAALRLAENIRQEVQQLKLPNPDSDVAPVITLSIGVITCVPAAGESPRTMLDYADQALYHAKSTGRNRVSVYNIVTHQCMDAQEVTQRNVHTEALSALATFSYSPNSGALEISDAILEHIPLAHLRFSSLDALAAIVHPDEVAALQRALTTCDEQLPPFRLLGKDGSIRWTSACFEHSAGEAMQCDTAQGVTAQGVTTQGAAAQGATAQGATAQGAAAQDGVCIDDARTGAILDLYGPMLQGQIPQLRSGDGYGFIYDILADTFYCSKLVSAAMSFDDTAVPDASKVLPTIMSAEDYTAFRNTLMQAYASPDGVFECSFNLIRPDGDVFMRCSGEVLHVLGRAAIVQGSLLEMESTEGLRDELTFAESVDSIFVYETATDTLSFSDSILEYILLDKPEIEGFSKNYANFIYRDDIEFFESFVREMLDEKLERFRFEVRIQGNEGQPVTAELRGRSRYDERGLVTAAGTLGVSHPLMLYKAHLGTTSMLSRVSGLPGRAALYTVMESALHNESQSGYLMLIDIDNFKLVNNLYGHATGDKTLAKVGQALRHLLPESALVFHYSVDQFAIALLQTHRMQAEQIVYALLEEPQLQRLEVGDTVLQVTYSLGAVVFHPHKSTLDSLLVNVDLALQKAKQNGHNCYAFLETEDREQYMERMELEAELRRAIASDFTGFDLYYQPLHEHRTLRCIGAEALLRYTSPNGERVSPPIVVSTLERMGFMVEVERWLLARAAKQCMEWLEGDATPDFTMHVNLSTAYLARSGILGDISFSVLAAGLQPANFVLEITENSLVQEAQREAQILAELRAMGYRIAVDDFGTGYSSLSYLNKLPVDIIKIDRAFLLNLEDDEKGFELLRAIVQMTSSMGYRICQEGVETQEQLAMLEKLPLHVYQGYWFSRPLSAADFTQYLNNLGKDA